MEDRCVCCDEIVPEGTWVCQNCLNTYRKGELSDNRYIAIHHGDSFILPESSMDPFIDKLILDGVLSERRRFRRVILYKPSTWFKWWRELRYDGIPD